MISNINLCNTPNIRIEEGVLNNFNGVRSTPILTFPHRGEGNKISYHWCFSSHNNELKPETIYVDVASFKRTVV